MKSLSYTLIIRFCVAVMLLVIPTQQMAAAKEAYEMNYKQLQKAAGAGDTDAMYWLGMRHGRGTKGVPADGNLSREWLMRADEAGHPCAAGVLSNFADDGIIDASDNERVTWWRHIIERHTDSSERLKGAVNLANAYYAGVHGVNQDYAAVVDILEPILPKKFTASNAFVAAQGYMFLGEALWKMPLNGDLTMRRRAYEAYIKLIESIREIPLMNLTDSQLGMMQYGKFMAGNARYIDNVINAGAADFSEVKSLWSDVAYDIHDYAGVRAQARNNLGQMLVTGADGVAVDSAEGWKLLGQAVQGGNLQARWFTAIEFCKRGEYDKAKIHFEHIISNDSANDNVKAAACMELSKMYRFGRGVAEDVAQANRLVAQASDLGNPDAAEVAELIMNFKK